LKFGKFYYSSYVDFINHDRLRQFLRDAIISVNDFILILFIIIISMYTLIQMLYQYLHFLKYHLHLKPSKAMARAVSRRLLNAVWVRSQVRPYEICDRKVALGKVCIRVLRFSLSISFHRGSPYSHIVWGINNRPVRGRRLETQSNLIDMKQQNHQNYHHSRHHQSAHTT
jgi:hypothetical protein